MPSFFARFTRAHVLLLSATLVATALGAVPARATGPSCDGAVTTAQMIACSGEAFNSAVVKMQDAYDRLHARLDPDRQSLLAKAQAAWETFRDQQADYVASSMEGGTLYPVLRLSELTRLTERRTSELQILLEEED